MKHVLAATAAAALLIGATAGYAQNLNAPGQQMKANGSVNGHAGASGYAPGHQMQTKGSVSGTTGASGYAPSHVTTGAGVKGNADVDVGSSRAKTGIDAGAKVNVR